MPVDSRARTYFQQSGIDALSGGACDWVPPLDRRADDPAGIRDEVGNAQHATRVQPAMHRAFAARPAAASVPRGVQKRVEQPRNRMSAVGTT
jgi:hypothetical protein